MTEQILWCGRVDVVPEVGNEIFEGAAGAFTNVVAVASGEIDYETQVRVGFLRERLIVQRIEQIQPISGERSLTLTSELQVAAAQVAAQGGIAWDTFYVYESDDDD